MGEFLTAAINGGLTGLIYGLIAMGFVVVYRSSRVFNFAQGEFVVIGGFLVYDFAHEAGLPVAVAIVAAMISAALIGLVIQQLLFSRLVAESIFTMVMVTIGLLVLLQGAVLMVWGPLVRPFPRILPVGTFRPGDVFISQSLLCGGILTIVLAVGFLWFFNRSRAGLRMSAVAEDHTIAMSMGISVKRTASFAWIAGSVISVLGAVAYFNGKSLSFGSSSVGLVALPVALLGGTESLGGLIPAGLIIGVTSGLSAAYLDPDFSGASLVMPYLVMLLVMAVRPQGLFGWRQIERI